MVKINLLRERAVEQPGPKLPVEHKPIQGILVMVVLLIAAVAFGVWYGWSKYKIKEDLRISVENLNNEAKNLDLEGIKAKMDKYREKVDLLKKRSEILNQLKKNQTGPKEMMQVIEDSLPMNEPKLWLEKMQQTRDEQGNESLVISGLAYDVPAITAFSTSLQDKNYFDFVDLIKFDETTPPVKFELHCRKVKKVEKAPEEKSQEKEAKNG